RPMPLDRPEISRAFDRLYAGNDALSETYRRGQAARAELINDLAAETRQADNGAPPSNGFPLEAVRLAPLVRPDRRIRLAFASLGGWDTHVSQGRGKGQLANRLQPLGEGLMALAKGLGRDWDDTVVAVISEFGRTVRENGNGGTDHGHGNVIWVLGGSVRGGRFYGDWPGLAKAQLYQGRDLAVTTDYRTAFATILERHLGLADSHLAQIFPDLPRARSNLVKINLYGPTRPSLGFVCGFAPPLRNGFFLRSECQDLTTTLPTHSDRTENPDPKQSEGITWSRNSRSILYCKRDFRRYRPI